MLVVTSMQAERLTERKTGAMATVTASAMATETAVGN